jgi:pyruvate/2-oxoglutarate dehydrogenase complex dihydrolipoamide dehydrogenase (E3) component
LDMYHGQAAVTGPNEVTIDHDRVLAARYILLCTGSRPIVPDIPGLVDTGFLTNESVFELTDPPKSVAIVGGGPIGVELAQAFARLGIVTTVLQRDDRILLREEPQLAESLQTVLRSEGVTLHLRAEVTAVRVGGGHKTVVADIDGHVVYVTVDDILVAAGRRPNIDGLGLESLGIEATELAVAVDERGRTLVKSIYAVGDIAGRHRFTHSAGYEGIRAVRDMFFPGKGNVDDFIPWCTFTDPELAHAGMTMSEAEVHYGEDTDVWQIGLDHNDRARADGVTEGAIIIVTAKGRIVGAHILAPSAGELIHELALAIRHQMKIDDVAQLVHVYPTLASSVGQLAASAALEKAQRLRWLVKRR